MTRIIMSGCNGAMGRTIANIVEEDAEAKIVAGVDVTDAGDRSFPVFFIRAVSNRCTFLPG